MISIKEAKSIFTKAHPELTVIAIKSWDAEHYVLIALKDPNKQEMDPYYGIDKKTGAITNFSPAGQFKKFFLLFKINKPDGVEEDQKEVYEEMKHSAREWYMNSSTDELMHYGILGMHWGVRRFQNPDGSLTPEGRERYGRKIARNMRSQFHRTMLFSGKQSKEISNKYGLKAANVKVNKLNKQYFDKLDSDFYGNDKVHEKFVQQAYKKIMSKIKPGDVDELYGQGLLDDLRNSDYDFMVEPPTALSEFLASGSKSAKEILDIREQVFTAKDEYKKARDHAAEDLLDKYADTVVRDMETKEEKKAKEWLSDAFLYYQNWW